MVSGPNVQTGDHGRRWGEKEGIGCGSEVRDEGGGTVKRADGEDSKKEAGLEAEEKRNVRRTRWVPDVH